MCTATSRGPQFQDLENLYRCEDPQKEESREFDSYFLIESNNYQTNALYIRLSRTLLVLFFTKQQVSTIQNIKRYISFETLVCYVNILS